jgi:glycosyltransferase involved in cell wall biosynthesis
VRILGLPNGVNGAAYYRVFLPLSHAERHSGGEHVVSFPAPAEAGKLGGTWISGHDVIVGQCIARNGAQMWESFRDDGDGVLVYEADDDLITPIDERYHPSLVQYNQPELRESHIRALKASDLVTVSTPVLGERLSRYNPRIVVLPNRVNADLLALTPNRRERVTVGWQGSATHLGDMQFHRDPIRRFLQRTPGADLHIMGGDYRETLGFPQARYTPWQTDMWDYYEAVDFDIGLAPLMPNSFNEAKSPVKALEYAALGIPVVASDVTAYRDFVADGVTGFLVRRDHEWGQRLRDLVNDEAMRAEMGAKAREHASHHTIQEHWPQWPAAYEKVMTA